ncbi:DNA cytosine methyltransferase [Candidatus Pelagadaptatus aseana]|uniref:DNA cytosine methyltransferase n=1 Tax=Candidatus Pelagadaptatus aseana TaxID=3120508 RepID=UPI003C6FC183
MGREISAVDLFCGAGGLTHGLIKSKINVVAGFDIEKSCKFAYEKNNKGAKFLHQDVSTLTAEELKGLYPKGHIKLLAGCAPCQPFSTYSQGRDVRNDKKWPLLYEFARLIRQVKPELVTMENVPDVIKHEVYHDFVLELEGMGYHVWADAVYCPDYGIPQSRTRHVLLASKLGPVEIVKPTHKQSAYKTVADTIFSLPAIAAGESDPLDPLHKSSALSPLNLQRIRASEPGGSWWSWPEELRAACHRKSSGRSYSGVYARMSWDQPSPTMTTQCYGYGNGRFGHPEQDRAISLREAALFQTFPRKYQFVPKGSKVEMTPIGKMIGNAVPVRLGTIIGRSLLRQVI